MRVTCDACKSVYAVDDKLIPPKGARSRCPRCKALQLILPSAPPPSAPLPAAPRASALMPPPLPKSAGQGSAASAGGVNPPARSASLFDELLDQVVASPPPVPKQALDDSFAELAPLPSTNRRADPFAGFDEKPSAGMADPFAGLDFEPGLASPAGRQNPGGPPDAPEPQRLPSTLQPSDANLPAPALDAAPPSALAFEDLFGHGEATPASVPLCRSCRKPLTDPFDGALGSCEDCRAKEERALATPPVRQPKTSDEDPAVPWTANPPSSRPEKRRKTPPAAKPAAAAALRAQQRVASARRSKLEDHSGSGKWMVAFLGVAIGIGAGWIALTRPRFLFERPVKKIVVRAVEARLPGWKAATPVKEGSAADQIARGRRAFLVDKPASYLEAEEAFKAAIVLDPTDLKAVSYFVEALAVGHGERASRQDLAEARELIDAVLEAKPALAVAHRAKATLLLAVDEIDVARIEAEDALRLSGPGEQAEALLVVGCTYLKKSAPIAQEKIDAALNKDKTLKRAWYYRGLANEYAGRYAAALADFGERLKLDPDQREALRAEARVHAKLGDFEASRKALVSFASKHPSAGEPRVLLAQLAYAVQRNLRDADKMLRELNGEEARFDDIDKLQFRSLGSAVARERGDLKTAVALAEAALKIDSAWAPAHFQKMLAHLAANEPEKARVELAACEARLGDLARAAEYLGRIEVAAGDVDKAIAAYRKALDRAPARIAPKLNLAALLVRKGDLNQAWAIMRKALDADPTPVARRRPQVSDFFEEPVDGIRSVAKAFDIPSDEMDWLPRTYAALAQYHLGESERPERTLDRVLAVDPSSLPALLYRAQIELDRKRYDKALAFAKRAVAAERQSAVAYYLLARAEEGLKKPEQARADYLAALERDPALAPASTRLGMLASGDDAEVAKKSLLQALAIDPDDMEARVALFKLGY